MKRLDWLSLWDRLRAEIASGNTSWGRNQILDLMDNLERQKIRELERESNNNPETDSPS